MQNPVRLSGDNFFFLRFQFSPYFLYSMMAYKDSQNQRCKYGSWEYIKVQANWLTLIFGIVAFRGFHKLRNGVKGWGKHYARA